MNWFHCQSNNCSFNIEQINWVKWNDSSDHGGNIYYQTVVSFTSEGIVIGGIEDRQALAQLLGFTGEIKPDKVKPS